MSLIDRSYARPESNARPSRPERRRRVAPSRSAFRAARDVSTPARNEGATARPESLPSFRLPNTLLAALLLVATAPLMAVIALAIKLTSPGPVIYRQPRVGRDRRKGGRPNLGDRRRSDLGGSPFSILKFRTMYHVSGPQRRQIWTEPNDRRVTRVGRILRLYRLDELPQTVNVLKGDMNVVGPRPEQPEIFARLREQFERFPERQVVPPGITGLAQVESGYGGSAAEVEYKLKCDLEYLEQRSGWTDLQILLRTVPVVITRRGAR